MRFFEEKSAFTECSPEPLAIWNKKLEGLESELFKGLKAFPIAAPEHIPGFFYLKRTRIQDLGMFSGSLLLSDVAIWWWLRIMLFVHELYSVFIFFRICSFLSTIPSRLSPLSLNSVFSLCPLFRLVLLVLLVHVHCSFSL